MAAIVNKVTCDCEEYGTGSESNCTEGFPSLFHIDKVVGNTDLDIRSRQQSVFPAINFTCNGTIMRWIISARWRGIFEAFSELQIWRPVSGDEFVIINSTIISATSENDSEIYELETSLAFQEGDVLGYFQPDESILELYLEDSHRSTTYFERPVSQQLTNFFLSEAEIDTRYPITAVRTGIELIAILEIIVYYTHTDPPGCGCGFMSEERVYGLLDISSLQTRSRQNFNDQQLLFPSVTFRCNGYIVKWIVGARWNSGMNSPELQIWQPVGDNIYRKKNSTVILADVREDDEVYEFPLTHPLPVQPGDILGLLQPPAIDSQLRIAYEKSGTQLAFVIVSTSVVSTLTAIPLVTVEIGELQFHALLLSY